MSSTGTRRSGRGRLKFTTLSSTTALTGSTCRPLSGSSCEQTTVATHKVPITDTLPSSDAIRWDARALSGSPGSPAWLVLCLSPSQLCTRSARAPKSPNGCPNSPTRNPITLLIGTPAATTCCRHGRCLITALDKPLGLFLRGDSVDVVVAPSFGITP